MLVPDGDGAHVRLTSDRSSLAIDPEYAWVAPHRLDAAQLDGLARLLAHYRQPNDGMCTSSTTLLVTTHLRGFPALRERFHDASCSAHDAPGVLALYEVIRYQPAEAR